MNIFLLDEDPKLAAIYHHDKHVVKMPLETSQMLCTNIYMLHGLTSRKKAYKDMEFLTTQLFPNFPKSDTREYPFYRLVMPNHPCTIWLRESRENFKWTMSLLENLLLEYSRRFEKFGKLHEVYKWLCEYYPYDKLPDVPMTPFRLAIADESLHNSDAIQAYRDYYISEKLTYTHKRSPRKVLLHKWTNRNRPEWITDQHVYRAIEKTKKEKGWV